MVVALRGEQDLSTATRVAHAIAGAAALGDGGVIVDLSGVRFMDAAVVGTLVRGRNQLRLRARSLTVRAPSPRARAVLELCDVADLVEPGPGAGPGLAVVRGLGGSCVTLRGAWSSGGVSGSGNRGAAA
jgi:anti-anti-sigma factor